MANATQNVFYVNPVTGNNSWNGRASYHAGGTSLTGPVSTVQAGVSRAITGGVDGFEGAVVILMSDGGASGDAFATGPPTGPASNNNWRHDIAFCNGTVNITGTAKHGITIIGGNTGGIIDGTIATVAGPDSTGVCSEANTTTSLFKISNPWVALVNLDLYTRSVSSIEGIVSHGAPGPIINVANCNFKNNKQAVRITGTGARVFINKCSFIDCATGGLPVIEGQNLTVVDSEINSCTTGILVTGAVSGEAASEKPNRFLFASNTAFINSSTRGIKLNGAFGHITDCTFISGTTDIGNSNDGITGYPLLAINTDHLENTGQTYRSSASSHHGYMISTLFAGDNKFATDANTFTTGPNTTQGDEDYNETSQLHNMMERLRTAFVNTSANPNVTGEDGYFKAFISLTDNQSAFDSKRDTSLKMDATAIKAATPEGNLGFITSFRGQNLTDDRGSAIAVRSGLGKDILDGDVIDDNDGGKGTITLEDAISRYTCSQLDCCCDDYPVSPYGGNGNAINRTSGFNCLDLNCGDTATPGAGNSLSVSVF